MPSRLSAIFTRGDAVGSDTHMDHLEQGVLQHTDLGDVRAAPMQDIPEPLARHRADAEQILQDLGYVRCLTT
jgi:hypothetical protein